MVRGMSIGTAYFAKAIEDKGCTKRTRTRASASLPRPSPKGGRSSHIRFCETNPIYFQRKTAFMLLCIKLLWRKKVRKKFGFVLENEPILGGMRGSVAANTTSRRLVRLGLGKRTHFEGYFGSNSA